MRVEDRGNGPEIQVQVDIDLDGKPIDEVTNYLRDRAEGLSDVKVGIEHEYNYGDGYVRQYIAGWRPATDQERQQAARERAEAEQRERQWQERQAEQLRKARPDLFA